MEVNKEEYKEKISLSLKENANNLANALFNYSCDDLNKLKPYDNKAHLDMLDVMLNFIKKEQI